VSKCSASCPLPAQWCRTARRQGAAAAAGGDCEEDFATLTAERAKAARSAVGAAAAAAAGLEGEQNATTATAALVGG
jgi:hypothetical protein